MIKSIKFSNYRNLDQKKYEFDKKLNIIVGENSSGKTNLLDGIRLAFSAITEDYVKVKISDFKDSNDDVPICIEVELEENSIPSLQFWDENGNTQWGFKMTVCKTSNGRYRRTVEYLNGSSIDYEILREDQKIPNVCIIPFVRAEDIYSEGMITSLSNFMDSEEKYSNLKQDYLESAKESISEKKTKFQRFCKKFNQNLDIAFSEPRVSDEKVFIVEDGEKAHNYKVGSGYKSIANIILNAMNDRYSIVLIDEIENHLHPSLVRTLIREIREMNDIIVIGTTHSPVVVNSLKMEEISDISGAKFSSISEKNKRRLNEFLHPGRGEMILATNVILVEGFCEEILLRAYLDQYNHNWTVINVQGIMFEPYIELAHLLNKKVVVISDNDMARSDTCQPSNRFKNLKSLCDQCGIKLIEVYNTLESDLYNDAYLDLDKYADLLTTDKKHENILIAKDKKKTQIAEMMIEDCVNLSEWHVIREVKDEFLCD